MCEASTNYVYEEENGIKFIYIQEVCTHENKLLQPIAANNTKQKTHKICTNMSIIVLKNCSLNCQQRKVFWHTLCSKTGDD